MARQESAYDQKRVERAISAMIGAARQCGANVLELERAAYSIHVTASKKIEQRVRQARGDR